MHNLWQKQENRKKKLICPKCGKFKEAEDCNWVTINGNKLCLKDGEEPIFIDDDENPKMDKIVNNISKNTPNELKKNPDGPMFLTKNGDWIGRGNTSNDSQTNSHIQTILDAQRDTKTKLIIPGGQDNQYDIIDKTLTGSGMVRTRIGSELSIYSTHNLSSSQRSSLKDIIISKGYSKDDIMLDFGGKMNNINTDKIINSLLS